MKLKPILIFVTIATTVLILQEIVQRNSDLINIVNLFLIVLNLINLSQRQPITFVNWLRQKRITKNNVTE